MVKDKSRSLCIYYNLCYLLCHVYEYVFVYLLYSYTIFFYIQDTLQFLLILSESINMQLFIFLAPLPQITGKQILHYIFTDMRSTWVPRVFTVIRK
jgi:hypothetical protein